MLSPRALDQQLCYEPRSGARQGILTAPRLCGIVSHWPFFVVVKRNGLLEPQTREAALRRSCHSSKCSFCLIPFSAAKCSPMPAAWVSHICLVFPNRKDARRWGGRGRKKSSKVGMQSLKSSNSKEEIRKEKKMFSWRH